MDEQEEEWQEAHDMVVERLDIRMYQLINDITTGKVYHEISLLLFLRYIITTPLISLVYDHVGEVSTTTSRDITKSLWKLQSIISEKLKRNLQECVLMWSVKLCGDKYFDELYNVTVTCSEKSIDIKSVWYVLQPPRFLFEKLCLDPRHFSALISREPLTLYDVNNNVFGHRAKNVVPSSVNMLIKINACAMMFIPAGTLDTVLTDRILSFNGQVLSDYSYGNQELNDAIVASWLISKPSHAFVYIPSPIPQKSNYINFEYDVLDMSDDV